jgi:hypothetical protein
MSFGGMVCLISYPMVALVLLKEATARFGLDIIFEKTLPEPVSNRTSDFGKT